MSVAYIHNLYCVSTRIKVEIVQVAHIVVSLACKEGEQRFCGFHLFRTRRVRTRDGYNTEFDANLESVEKVTNNLFEISLPKKSLRVAVFCKVIKNEKPHNTLLC